MNERNRLASDPARIDRSVAMKPAPSSESHSGNNIDGNRVAEFFDGHFAQRADDVHRVDRDVNGRGEQLLLGAEVVMHQRRIDARRRGYRAYRGVRNPIAGEQLSCTRRIRSRVSELPAGRPGRLRPVLVAVTLGRPPTKGRRGQA